MRLPDEVNICGKIYKVNKDAKSYDGKGSTAKCEMTVGTKNKNPERQFEILVHEIMEIAAVERDIRYSGARSEDLLFVMSHKEFDTYSVDVANAIRPMVRS